MIRVSFGDYSIEEVNSDASREIDWWTVGGWGGLVWNEKAVAERRFIG